MIFRGAMAGAMNEKDLLRNWKALNDEVLSMGGFSVGGRAFVQKCLPGRYLVRAIEQLWYARCPETVGKARFIPHKVVIRK
jgi:hypothetical protein